jgi:hypothetical protein
MRLKYVGPLTEGVEIPELGGLIVAHEEIIDVDDAIGKRLALSPDWHVTSKTTKKEGD